MYIEDEAKDDRLGLRGTRSILLEADVRAIKRWSCIDSRFGVLSCCRLPSGDRFCLSILDVQFWVLSVCAATCSVLVEIKMVLGGAGYY